MLVAIGERLVRARNAVDLTQEEAAYRARIDYKRLQKLEKGKVNATVRTLLRLADVYGVGFWALMSSAPRRSSKR